MEGLVSATLGELVSRCISFLINKYSTAPPLSKMAGLQRLERMLLRVLITVEEAEGRCITNQAMLRQLKMLREEMWRGYYMLDIFRYLAHEEEKAKDHQAACSLALSISNPGKRAFLSASARPGEKELKQMIDTVENIVTSMTEFVVFLKNYPPICHQPYSMHMFLGKCMFGRQVEMERVITFLLQREPPGEHKLGVLPIVGQGKVGKTTLVEHVCGDVRVRDHFSQIVLFCGNKSIEGELCPLREGGIIKHRGTCPPNEEKMLVVIELDGDVDDGAWRQLNSASRSFIPRGSKIIITSRSENITRLGTTHALWLKFLPREANWYLFKVLVFGGTDPEEQPKLASIAMQIFEEFFDLEVFNDFTGPIANSINIAAILRANISIQHFRRILICVKGNRQRNPLQLSSVPSDTCQVENKHLYIQRVAKLTQDCVVDSHVRVALADEDTPKITMDDIISGSITPQGRFDVVVWKSHLPPYYSYITSCEIHESKFMLARKKGCKRRKDLC
jgi:GTPase SAR1 family protein